MGYGKKVYEEAAAELARRRQKAEDDALLALEDFNARCEEGRRTKEAIAQNAQSAVKVLMQGGNVRKEMEKLQNRAAELNEHYDALLAQYGYTRKDVTPQYACPRCKDTGLVDGRLCDCLKNLQRSIAYKRLSLEVPLEKCSFDTFSLEHYKNDERAYRQMENILNTCESYVQRFRANSSSLLFKGGTGLGKTHLSLAIAGAAIEKGFGVIYGSAQSFAVALEKERFDRRDEDRPDDTHSQLLDCDLLILDDLGTEFPSAYVNAALYDIVNRRMLAEKPTIISTNLSLKQMQERYGERFVSRVAGYYNMMQFLGDDRRVSA